MNTDTTFKAPLDMQTLPIADVQVRWPQLSQQPTGHWRLTDVNGAVHEPVTVVRAFPVSDPQQGVAVVDSHGHELAWFSDLQRLPSRLVEALEKALQGREFMPVIEKLLSVSSFATPSTWEVRTDRGLTRMVLKGEEDIRRLRPGVLLVTDHYGVQYLIRNLLGMDKHSRKLLDRFL